MESVFLLAFSDEEFLAALAMARSGTFFNKLLIRPFGLCLAGACHCRGPSITTSMRVELEYRPNQSAPEQDRHAYPDTDSFPSGRAVHHAAVPAVVGSQII
jgi:hypothetical protein